MPSVLSGKSAVTGTKWTVGTYREVALFQGGGGATRSNNTAKRYYLGRVCLGLFQNRNSWNDQLITDMSEPLNSVAMKVLQPLWNESSPRTNNFFRLIPTIPIAE